MPLIHDIQSALLDEKASVGEMLIKLRFLAAKLDTNILEKWVQYEVEGYPKTAELPDYRIAQITYTGTFIDPSTRLYNVSIPGCLIELFAGKHWVEQDIREGLPLIESQLKSMGPDSHFGIDCSNLKVLLHDKICQGMGIVEIKSRIDTGAFARIRHAVRTKTLDFTLTLEKQVSAVKDIEVGAHPIELSSDDQKNVENLTLHVFYGNVTNIHNSGDANSRVNLNSTDNSANVTE